MAYATFGDVASEYKDIAFTSTTKVTDTEVSEFITQTENRINAEISNRYSVPVASGTMAASILKTISIWLVKCRINSILSVKSPVDSTKQEPDGKTICEKAEDMLKAIVLGTLGLPDAEASGLTGGMESFLMNEDVEYQFQRDENAW